MITSNAARRSRDRAVEHRISTLLGQGRVIDEIDARQVLFAGLAIDELGVGERLDSGASTSRFGARFRAPPERLAQFVPEAIVARRLPAPRHVRAPSAARLFAMVPPAPGVTSVRDYRRSRGMPVSREGSLAPDRTAPAVEADIADHQHAQLRDARRILAVVHQRQQRATSAGSVARWSPQK